MPSQKEIARKLNLSQATVSRALNDDNSLPLATKLKVKKLALELGYEPRRYEVRNLEPLDAEKNNRVLALICHAPTLDGKYYTLLLEMIQGFIQAAKKQLTLIVKEVKNEKTARGIISKYSNNVLGAVLILRYPEELADLFRRSFPCISLNHRYEKLKKIPTVEPLQETAFVRLYHYLYENGHRRIGFLTAKNSYQFAQSRYSGYLQAVCRLNGCYAPEWIINILPDNQLDLPEIADRIAQLYRKERVDAYLCTSGHFAKKLIAELAVRGLQVPEDISLAAFDDILTPDAEGHLLCGEQANYEHLAKMAIQMLRTPSAFSGASVVCCDTEFHRGNTVSVVHPDEA